VLQVGIAVASALDQVHAGGVLRLDVSTALYLMTHAKLFLGGPELRCMFTARRSGVDFKEVSALVK
jgi:hypothetical protein